MIMFFVYQILLTLLLIISPVIILVRIFKNKEDKIRFKEKFGFFSVKNKSKNLIWVHGASVGELMSVLPIIDQYEKNKKIDKILVTTSTLSSSRILEKLKYKKVIHQFFPIDHVFFSKKFINYWKPNLAIFLESEIWPSMFKEIKKNSIPLILLNARITPKSFSRWIKMKHFSQLIFNLIDIAYPQNKETKIFLKKLNVKIINFIGNLKFIERNETKYPKNEKKLFSKLKKFKTFIAASTHNSEELLAAKTHILLKRKYKNIITIIIPRHIHRVDEIINEMTKLQLNVTTHSSKKGNLKNTDIYIVDTFGESKKFYKIATTVFVGGSIADKGGQNPLEPARFGTKILHGPNIGNFREVYRYLNSLNISSKVTTPVEFSNSIKFKKDMKKVRKIKILGNTILKKTIKELDKFINNEI